MTESNWSEDRITILTSLWLSGHSASQIAKALGGFEEEESGDERALMFTGELQLVFVSTRRSRSVRRPVFRQFPRRDHLLHSRDEQVERRMGAG